MPNPFLFPLLLIAPGALAVRLAWPRKDLEFAERLGLSVGLSLAITPVIISVTQYQLSRVDERILWAIVGISLIGTLFPKPGTKLGIKFSRWDALMGLILIIAFAFVFSNFTKYPFFPRFYSNDFTFHLEMARLYLQGKLNALVTSYPPSTHILVATGITALGGEGFSPMQLSMAFVAALSTLLIYAATSILFEGKSLALLASLLYILASPMWTIALQNSGIYPNLISNIVAVVLIITLISFTEKPTWKAGILLFIVGGGFYITHYTSPILLILALAFIPFVLILRRNNIKGYLIGAAIVSLPLLGLVYVRSNVIAALITDILAASPPSARFQPTPLTDFLGSLSQFLLFFYLETSSEILFFSAIAGSIAATAWLLKKRSSPWKLLPFIWFFVIFAVSTFSPNLGWRFAYNAHAPFVFVLPMTASLAYRGIQRMTVRQAILKKKGARPTKTERPRILLRGILVAGLIIVLLYNTSGVNFTADISNDPLSGRVIEESLMQSVDWINKKTQGNERFLAITEWKYLYLRVLAEREVRLEYYLTPEKAFDFSKAQNLQYVIVTAGKYPGPDKRPTDFIELYSQSKSFEKVYSNLIVSVYKVK